MKKFVYILMAALIALTAVSCNKDNNSNNNNDKAGEGNSIKYGIDGKTPLPEAVDIGLVVNGKPVKWASFNLGASKEHEFGNYYSWGETEPKAEYSDVNYKHDNGDISKLIAYCPKDWADFWDSSVKPEGPDGVLQLVPSDDAAIVHLGGKWRIPTLDEVQALLELQDDTEHYNWEKWAVISVDGKDVYGLRITQKSTGNSIFFPAAGSCNLKNIGEMAGENGDYWASSVIPSYPIVANTLRFDSKGSHSDGIQRYCGCPIRPVYVE